MRILAADVQGEMAATVPQLLHLLISICQDHACTVAAIHSQTQTITLTIADNGRNLNALW